MANKKTTKRPPAPSGPRAARPARPRPTRGGRRKAIAAGAGSGAKAATPISSLRAAPDAAAPFHGLSVVGITLGQAGMEACAELIAALPPDLGLAVVITFQTGPRHGEEQLRFLLAERSRLAVVEAADDMPLLPNRVHVMPPGALMSVEGGKLRKAPPPPRKQPHLPADYLFRSLATSLGPSAVGIVM